jgi:hypothetical protein
MKGCRTQRRMLSPMTKAKVIWKIWVPFLCPKCKTKGRTEAHISRCVTIVKKDKPVKKVEE